MTDLSTPQSPAPPPAQTINIQAPPIAPSNGFAVASMVLGIIALLFFWMPFLGWLPVVLGLVLGIVALNRPFGRGMAIAGIVCSGVALAVKLIFLFLFIGVLGAIGARAPAAAGDQPPSQLCVLSDPPLWVLAQRREQTPGANRMNYQQLLFSFNGRIRRLHYWLVAMVLGVVYGIVVNLTIGLGHA